MKVRQASTIGACSRGRLPFERRGGARNSPILRRMNPPPEEPQPSPAPAEAPPAPAWTALPDAELLQLRISSLGLRLEGSGLEARIAGLERELEAKGISFRPHCYLGDEWFSPEDIPTISIPFFLAHPRLIALEKKMMLEVEGESAGWFAKLLRHECGHAIEHAYQLHRKTRRKELFGPRSADYDPDTYRPHPYSRSFVRNLPNWYAQAHPDEDFAETFAVWLNPESDWRKQYKGWKALAKLEYVDALMKELAAAPPKVTTIRCDSQVSQLRVKLDTFYKRRRREYAADAPDFYDRDLQELFTPSASVPQAKTATQFLRKHRKELIDSVSRWTGERKVAVELLVKRLAERTETLGLSLTRDEARTSIELTAYLATLVTNYQFTGKFKRSV